MVLELAKNIAQSGGHVCFLGDPAQAIYDFQTDQLSGISSVDFLRAVIDGAATSRSPRRFEFTNYRRFETPEMLALVRSARDAMGADGLDPDAVQLDSLIQQAGEQLQLAALHTRDDGGTSAILTRDNLEAYQIWNWCRVNNIAAELWRGARGGYWPGWIAMLTLGFKSERMSIDMARRRWEALEVRPVGLEFEGALSFMYSSGLLRDDESSIPVLELGDRMARLGPPQGNVEGRGALVISTIHRSKGLEFDHVIVLSPRSYGSSGPEDDEVRVMYVAATRAKRSLRVLARDKSVVRYGQKKGRDLKTSNFHILKYPAAPRIGLLIDGYDTVDPSSIAKLEDPIGAQKRLWQECCSRERIVEVFDREMKVSECTIGTLTTSLQADIARIRSFRRDPDPSLTGIRVVDLATVPVEDPEGDRLGVASLALVPVTTGIGSC